MEAGSELDALVAEKVMGRKYHTRQTHFDVTGMGGACSLCFPPSYSTDIAAAWTVVEHMKHYITPGNDIGLPVMMMVEGSQSSCEWHGGKQSFNDGTGWVRADTMPLAICLMALKAVGHEL